MGIYDLKLHETTSVTIMRDSWAVTRVPGGWIYQNNEGRISSPFGFFVPFDNTFQNNGKCECVIPKPKDAYDPEDKNICNDCNLTIK